MATKAKRKQGKARPRFKVGQVVFDKGNACYVRIVARFVSVHFPFDYQVDWVNEDTIKSYHIYNSKHVRPLTARERGEG